MTRTALIVGAGIGGLSGAIALRKAGWHVRVFERASSVRELGFALLVAPNAMAALRELGVADVVLARGIAPARGEARRMDGTVLKRADFPAPEVMGGPTVVALRPAVHGALLEAVGEHKVKLGCEATGFSVAGDRVTLRTVAGDIAEGDLLVYWALSLAEELVPAGMRDDPAAILRHMAPRFEETFRGVTAETTDMRVDELCDRDPLPFWGKGPVTLLGDAAHPVLPHTGQGAAQAMVDAVVLGQALGENGDVEGALRSYERHRRDEDRDPGGPGTPDGADHGNDEPGGLPAARSRRAAGAHQDLGEDVGGHQPARGHGRQPVSFREPVGRWAFAGVRRGPPSPRVTAGGIVGRESCRRPAPVRLARARSAGHG